MLKNITRSNECNCMQRVKLVPFPTSSRVTPFASKTGQVQWFVFNGNVYLPIVYVEITTRCHSPVFDGFQNEL